MATLPDASVLGARPTPQPGRGIAGYESGQSARALGQATQVVAKISDDISREEDAQAVFAARRQLDQWERDTIFDPEKGAVTLKGQSAFGLQKQLPDAFDKVAGEIEGGLTTNRQRQAFQQMAQSRREQVGSWADGHVLKQREAFDLGQYEADVKSFQDRAVLYSQDEAKVRTELAMMNERTVGFLRAKGISGEAVAEAVKENTTQMHMAVIADKVNAGDASGANAYLLKHAEGMSAKSIQTVRHSLSEGLARERSQAFGDEMDASGKPLADRLAEARKRFKGADEVAAVHEVTVRETQRNAAQAQAVKENESEVWKIVGNGGGRKQIPVARWNALDGQEQTKINNYLEQKWRQAEARAKGKEETDLSTFYGLVKMASGTPEDQSKFKEVDLMRYEPYIAKTEFKQLIGMQAGINKGDAKAMGEQAVVKKGFDLIKAELAGAGIDTTPNPNTSEGKKKAEQLAQFNLTLRESLLTAQEAKNGKLEDGEIRKISLGLISEMTVKGSGLFGSGFLADKKRVYQMTPAEKAKAYVRFGDIPKAMREEIVQEKWQGNKAKMVAPDEAEVERIYNAWLKAK